MTDLSTMTEKELAKLQKDIDKELQRRDKQKIVDARKAAEEAAAKFGFSLNEIIGGKAGKKPALAAKYANPENPSETWSGRGRQPGWYKTAVSKGKDPADLEI